MGQHSHVTYKVNIHLSPQHLSREDDLSQAVKRDFLKCSGMARCHTLAKFNFTSSFLFRLYKIETLLHSLAV